MTIDELFNIEIWDTDPELYRQSVDKWDSIAKPIDGLGYFEEMISRIAAAQGRVCPDISRKAMIIMCADNGVFEEGVSQTEQKVTRDVAELMGRKMSSVGIMAKDYRADFFVYDVGINSQDIPAGVIDAKIRRGTSDFLKEPAMTEDECLKAIDTGIAAVKKCTEEGYGIIATGEMGIGNTTTSTALLCALKGLDPGTVTGRGAGLSGRGLEKKISVIERGIEKYRGGRKKQAITAKDEAFEALRCMGGLDIAGLAGVFIGGALYHVPIVIDGLISATAAYTAEKLVPGCRNYMIASHVGRENGMDIILDELSLIPVICANLALGEGTGALLLFPMLDMVKSLYDSGTSFSDTEIKKYERFEE
ncbi:MAG: nicotinate-nucleotide--dimethylbenzimidazole phosphoribosyltransferase [Butyrivibrio sp.]|nr:nicotinate-nucleotide--dimethylbenzimidazole phosphoribosyltransferase [Butyrivibrio sp.]